MTLTERAHVDGIEAIIWSPRHSDFNEDLRAFGLDSLRAALRVQLAPQDVVRFMRGGNGQDVSDRCRFCRPGRSGKPHAGQSRVALQEDERCADVHLRA
jgi:hypothetical protein